jgi:hypothetical protein
MDWRTGGVQLSAKGVVIAILAVIRFRMRIRRRAHMLKVGFCQRRLVRRQWVMGRPTSSEEENGDKRRQQDQRKVTSLSVGQGEPPAEVINSYSQFGKNSLLHQQILQTAQLNDCGSNKGKRFRCRVFACQTE